jgi:predicted nucleic acid-binding protein
MKKIFLDGNVLISVLNKELPVFNYSSRVLSLAGSKQFKLYSSPTCFSIAYYFASKKSGTVKAREKIVLIGEHIFTAVSTETDVQTVAKNKKIKDFEDGLAYMAAIHTGCHCIVTEDTKDYYFSEIEVLNCKRFLEKYVLPLNQ